jgi:hypothetical protein
MDGQLLRRMRGSWHAWVNVRPALVLTLIMLLALLLGLAKLWLDPPSPEFNWENRWWQIALNVAHGDGYVACKPIYFPFCGPTNQVTAMREPLPVLMYAIIALLTNESLLTASAAGLIINLVTLVAVFCLGRELATTRTGLLAALLWALYLAPIRLFYSQLSGDLLATLGVTGSLLYLVRARGTGRALDWLAAGAWIGLAILSRSAVIAIALGLSAGLVIWPSSDTATRERFRNSSRRPIALFVLAWALVVSPWVARNYIAFGRPVIGSTLAGYYLYRQNHALPTDDYLRFVSGGEFVPVLQAMLARRPDIQGVENEAQMDSIYREEGLRIIAAEPLRYVALSGYRFFMLWFNWDVNTVYGKPNTAGDYVIMVQHALLLVAGGLGLRGHWRRAWPLAASVAAFTLLYMVVSGHVTYIVPVVPLLVTLSAVACARAGYWLSLRLRATAAVYDAARNS